MQLTHQPWRECVELVRELDVGAFTPGEGTLNLVPKVGIRRPTSKARHLEPVMRIKNFGPTDGRRDHIQS
jgi:hypothetical protein